MLAAAPPQVAMNIRVIIGVAADDVPLGVDAEAERAGAARKIERGHPARGSQQTVGHAIANVVDADNVALGIDAEELGIHGPWKIDHREDTVLESQAVEEIVRV